MGDRGLALIAARIGILTMAVVCVAAGQQPTFRSSINLVQVDVVVVDKDGQPVRDLTARDFQLFDRGKPVSIDAFQEVSREATASASLAELSHPVPNDVSTNSGGAADRVVVLVMDDLHVYKERTDKARELGRQVVSALGPSATMAVLFTSGHHSTEFTQDTAVLDAALATFKGAEMWRRPRPGDDKQRPPHIDANSDPMAVLDSVGRTGNVDQSTLGDFFDNIQQYKTLEDAAKMLASVEARRKAFVLVSEGIGKDLSGLFQAMAPADNVPQGGIDYISGDLASFAGAENPTNFHDIGVLAMMQSMRRGNVATYAMDPRGAVPPGKLALECVPPPPGLVNDPCADGQTAWESPVRQAQHGLELVAKASGGFAVTNSDDFAGGLQHLVDDIDHFYLLGFAPSDPAKKGYRALDVKVVGHPDWTLRFRHGYEISAPTAAQAARDPLVTLASDIVPRGDLPLRLGATALPGQGHTARVALTIEVTEPTNAMRDPDGRFRDVIAYDALIVNEKKARVSSLGRRQGRMTLSARNGTVPPNVTYQLADSLELQPGRYQVRVSASSTKLDRGGSVYLDFEVPDFASATAPLSGIVIGYADGPRIPVAPTSVASAPMAPGATGAPAAKTPPSNKTAALPPAVLPFAPTLDRVFTPNDRLRVYFEGVRAADVPMIQLIDAQDRVVRSVTPPAGDVSDVTLTLTDLPPGPYAIRASTKSGSMREVAIAIR